MSNKFPSLGDFSIPSTVFDTHEWMTDFLLDGDTGHECTLYYPDKNTECDNCHFSSRIGRSSGIYKTGGPIPFPAHGTCPRCGGRGRLSLPQTDTIDLRIYWETRFWIDIGVKFNASNNIAMTIGYMVDLPKMEKADKVLLNSSQQYIRRWMCQRAGEAIPHGFRRNRYFIQYVERISGA
jgi:hypothetical protein